MSKFYKYINEKNNLDDFDLEEFKNNCYPFLQLLKKNNYHFLYSGRKSNEHLFKKQVRKNRRPKDTPLKLHNLLDKAFKDEFGVKARSESLFVHTSHIRTHMYGNTYYTFPVGKNYKLIWNENIVDLFSDLDNRINKKIRNKIEPSSKYAFSVRLSDLIEKFDKSDYLRYNENIVDFQLPKNFLNKPPEKVKKMPKLRKNEFYDIIDKEISNIISEYKQGKIIKNDIDNEVMIVTDYVWFINKEMVNTQKFKQWIEENI